MRTLPLLVAVVAGAALASGCTIATDPVAQQATGAPRATVAPIKATPLPTPDVVAVARDAVFGNWRRAPAYPTGDLKASTEAACREETVVGDLPLAVLDARGEGEVTIVFADDDRAAVCFVTANEDGTATATNARAVAGYPAKGALDPEKLGVHDKEIVGDGLSARFVVFGRVGDKVHDVGASFDDWTWGKASMANGWYVIWWPGAQPALTIAASDSRSMALDSYTP